MTTISGTSSASSAQYASSIQSSHGAGQAGGMNAMKLQQWLKGQVGEMWSKVSDATSGVDQRNNAQRELAELQRQAGQTITPDGLGGTEAMRLFQEVLGPACLSIDHPRYLSFIPGQRVLVHRRKPCRRHCG